MENPFSNTDNSNTTSKTPSFMEPTDPLYLHPAESGHPLGVDTKLSGIENYLEWKRQMEIAICSRRKIGFLTGVVKRPTNDPLREDAWDTCNSLLIQWILQNVEKPIKNSVLYVKTAKEIWEYLQRQFSVSNGARKFRLNKELEDLEQGDKSICEYFTELRILWTNLEIMSDWPPISQVTPEVNAWLDAQLKEQEERKLFQFLNGLHSSYITMRTNVLMMTPLPTVEEAAALFQHEEAQRRNYKNNVKMEIDNSAFFAGPKEGDIAPAPTCNVCKRKGHPRDKCWKVIGYPDDHPVSLKYPEKSQSFKLRNNYQGASSKGYRSGAHKNKQSSHNRQGKLAGNVMMGEEQADVGGSITLTTQQFEQLMNNQKGKGVSYPETEDELEANFAGLSHQDY